MTKKKSENVFLSPAPFDAWLRALMDRRDFSQRQAAYYLGIKERLIYAVLSEHRRVALDTVDRALVADDDTIALRELYPQLYAETTA